MKVAIVHDYLHQYGGAEKVVESWLEIYPEADIYTSFFTPTTFKESKQITKAHKENRIKTSWLQSFIPKIIKFYKHFFWIYPIAMSMMKIKNYDVVLISSTYCGKNPRYENCPKLIHYCHSPTRFLHGLITETDHKTLNPIFRIVISIIKSPLRWMDLRAVKYLNKNNCVWIANSNFIKETIKQVYKTNSITIYPPINLDQFLKIKKPKKPQDYFLCHGRISFHKRLDLAIKGCLETNNKLIIGGTSALPSETDSLKKIVTDYIRQNPRKKGLITFLGRTTQKEYLELLKDAKGFLFPGKEDFGITPIEVLASGTPIIAYQAGGALEYVENKKNGIFFKDQSISSIKNAIREFPKVKFNPATIKKTSRPFSDLEFKKQIKKVVLD